MDGYIPDVTRYSVQYSVWSKSGSYKEYGKRTRVVP